MHPEYDFDQLPREVRRQIRKRRRQNQRRRVYLVIASLLLAVTLLTALFLNRWIRQKEEALSRYAASEKNEMQSGDGSQISIHSGTDEGFLLEFT